jgi:hypothetical protein
VFLFLSLFCQFSPRVEHDGAINQVTHDLLRFILSFVSYVAISLVISPSSTSRLTRPDISTSSTSACFLSFSISLICLSGWSDSLARWISRMTSRIFLHIMLYSCRMVWSFDDKNVQCRLEWFPWIQVPFWARVRTPGLHGAHWVHGWCLRFNSYSSAFTVLLKNSLQQINSRQMLHRSVEPAKADICARLHHLILVITLVFIQIT